MYKQINVKRISKGSDSTIGLLTIGEGITEHLFCYTCEDEQRVKKVANETRIPAGRYEIKLRNAGSMNARYSERFSYHSGMPHLQDVPNFEYIYIHIGNDDDDTSGCILVGDGQELFTDGGGKITKSAQAYERLYMKIRDWLENDFTVFVNIYDEGV